MFKNLDVQKFEFEKLNNVQKFECPKGSRELRMALEANLIF